MGWTKPALELKQQFLGKVKSVDSHNKWIPVLKTKASPDEEKNICLIK